MNKIRKMLSIIYFSVKYHININLSCFGCGNTEI